MIKYKRVFYVYIYMSFPDVIMFDLPIGINGTLFSLYGRNTHK